MKSSPLKTFFFRFKNIWFYFALIAHVGLGLMICLFIYGCLGQVKRLAIERWFAKRLLRILKIELKVVGAVKPKWVQNEKAFLFVSNHISWLDVFAFNAIGPVRFIAKSEIAKWPLIGGLARRTGTLFIERGSRHAVKYVVNEAAKRLESGEPLVVFPEGTTTKGDYVLPFHSNLLHSAVLANTHVVPVNIQYLDQNNQKTSLPAYVGEQSLLDNLKLLMANRGRFTIVLKFHHSFSSQCGRQEIAKHAYQTIQQEL